MKFKNRLLKEKDYVTPKKTYENNENNFNKGNISYDEIQLKKDQLFLETLLMVIWGHTIKYSFEKKKEEGGRGKNIRRRHKRP